MNTLRLIYRLIKKRKGSLVLLAIEIIISSIVMLSLLGKIVYSYENKELAKSFDGKNMYYFSPYSYYEDFDTKKLLDDNKVKNTKVCINHQLELKLKNGETLDALGYNKVMLEKMKLKILNGVNINNYKGTNTPIIGVGKKYRIGDKLVLSNGKICEVVSIIDDNSSVVNFNKFANSGRSSMEDIIAPIKGFSIIMPFDEKYDNSFVEYDAPQESQMIYFDDDPKTIEKSLKDYGDLTSMEDMQKNYIKDKEEFLYTNGLIGIIFFVLTITGVGGINYIQSEKNEKFYTVMFMLGMSKGKCMLVEAANTFIVIGVSFIAMVLFGGSIAEVTSPNATGKLEIWMYILIMAHLTLIYLISAVPFIRKSSQINVIELYKKNRE